MEHSESMKEIATALAKAQGAMRGAVKDSANPHFKSKYADLASVWDACREQLAANSLSIVQAPGPCADGRLEMTTMLLHASGEWISETLTIPLSKVDAQGYGSATTYARRYALAAMVGIAPEDDDGNAASQPAQKQPQAQNDTRITDAQFAELVTLSGQAQADTQAFCQYYKIPSIKDLPASRFDHAKAMLNKKLAERDAA